MSEKGFLGIKLARHLSEWRASTGHSQADVAYYCDVSTATISELERIGYCHSIDLLRKVCDLIGTHPRNYFQK